MLFIAELNQLPIWGTDIGNAYVEATTQKKKVCITVATYGLEFIATRHATKKSIEDRNLFRYLGVPTIMSKDYMFGHNESVIIAPQGLMPSSTNGTMHWYSTK
jgi:hypothetical protein